MVHFHISFYVLLVVLTNNLCQPLTIQEDGNATIKYKVKIPVTHTSTGVPV